jgi:hypothetical protein
VKCFGLRSSVNVAACEDCETVTVPFSALFFTSINCISDNGEWLHFIEYLLFARRQLVDTTTKLMMFFTVFVLLAAVLPVTVSTAAALRVEGLLICYAVILCFDCTLLLHRRFFLRCVEET